jgi:hypothetical protein
MFLKTELGDLKYEARRKQEAIANLMQDIAAKK